MSSVEDFAFDVEFMCCEVDRADDFRVVAADERFSEFVGVHPSEIERGKLFLHDFIDKEDREKVLKSLCKKGARYSYFDFCMKHCSGELVYIHCVAQNTEKSKISRLTLVDVSHSERKTEMIKKRADALGSLIDVIKVGICLFKVNKDMHFEAIYINNACCSFFGTEKDRLIDRDYRIDELIHPEDKSTVFQAIGASMATKKPIDMVMRVISGKDSFTWCKFSAAINRYDESGCPVFHATFTDVSSLKK
ncbi:MAG: PAS domain-containing protein [Eubacterium sp.]|nr:PAS domain-containing protein [Eubacterium sp.]